MKEHEKCKKTRHYRPQCAKWFSRYSISKSGIWARGYRHFVGFQPHFQFNMTSQTHSGALRPGSLTKMVILILNGNGFFNHLQIRRLDTTFARKPSKIMKFGL